MNLIMQGLQTFDNFKYILGSAMSKKLGTTVIIVITQHSHFITENYILILSN